MEKLHTNQLKKRFTLPVLLSMIGYLILAGITGKLFFHTFVESFASAIFWGVVMSIVLLGLVQQYIAEWLAFLREKNWAKIWSRDSALIMAAVLAGAVLTYAFSNDLNMGAVVAAGLVGIIAALTVPKLGTAAYCGAFVGMVSQQCLFTYYYVILAAVFAGLIFILSAPVFNGFGGKLGTIAYSGCIAAVLLVGSNLISICVPGWDTGWLILVYSIVAAVLTFSISIRLKHGPVMASGIVGLLGGLILPALYPDIGSTLAVVVICASFTGMSGKNRVSNEAIMALAGFVTGMVFIFSSPYMGGAGGKLGTIAFGSVIAVRGFINIVLWVKDKGFAGSLSTKDRNMGMDKG